DADSNVLIAESISTERDGGPDHVIGRMATLAHQMIQDADLTPNDVAAVGVGTPGPLTEDSAIVHKAPNMPGWVNVPLRDKLRDASQLPVSVFNDANCAAFAEYWAGAGKAEGVEHLILLTLGTGIGAGVVINGKLFAGAHNAGTELGHWIVERDGRHCGCEQRGCVEQYTSATAIANQAKQRRDAGLPTSMPENPTCHQVFTAAAEGDKLAIEVIDEATDYLGLLCVNLVRAFDPQMIVLGGGVAAAGDALLSRVRASFEKRTWTVRPERVIIETAALGNDAGFIGAAGLVAKG
ncbi:MAG: ROK family protein, partial [Planctomycetota bacterium]